MDSNIKVESQTIVELLNSFQKEMTNLDNLIGKINTKNNEIKNSWEGNVSDTVLTSISNFNTIFDNIRTQNEKYVNFINSVIEKYTDEDESKKSFVNENEYSFTSDLYGKN